MRLISASALLSSMCRGGRVWLSSGRMVTPAWPPTTGTCSQPSGTRTDSTPKGQPWLCSCACRHVLLRPGKGCIASAATTAHLLQPLRTAQAHLQTNTAAACTASGRAPTCTSFGSTPRISAMNVSARTTSRVVTPNKRSGLNVPAGFGTVQDGSRLGTTSPTRPDCRDPAALPAEACRAAARSRPHTCTLEHLCSDGDCGVDGVADDCHPCVRAVTGDALAQRGHDASVDVEQVVPRHARLTGHACKRAGFGASRCPHRKTLMWQCVWGGGGAPRCQALP